MCNIFSKSEICPRVFRLIFNRFYVWKICATQLDPIYCTYMSTFFWVKVVSWQLWLYIVYAICSDIDHLMAARDIRKQQLPGKKLTGTRQSSSSGQKIATDRWCAPFWALGLELQSFDLVFSVDLIFEVIEGCVHGYLNYGERFVFSNVVIIYSELLW